MKYIFGLLNDRSFGRFTNSGKIPVEASAGAGKATSSGRTTASATRPTRPARAVPERSSSRIPERATEVEEFVSEILARELTSISRILEEFRPEGGTVSMAPEELAIRS